MALSLFFYAFINFYTLVTGWTNGQILNIFHTFSVDCLPDQAYLQFYGDEFLRLLMIRFVFCCTTLRLHKLFRVRLNWIIIHVTIINTIWFIIISEKYLSHLSIFVNICLMNLTLKQKIFLRTSLILKHFGYISWV